MNLRLPVRAALWIVALAAYPATAPAATEIYNIDASHTAIVFSVSHANMSFTYGFFRQVQGRYMLDTTNPANSRFQLTIPAESLDTNHSERDTHLKSADFFNVKQFPSIVFDSTSVKLTRSGSDTIYEVTGNLTMHGETRPITIPLKLLASGPGLRNDYRTGFWTQFELNRSDFGMNNLLNIVGDKVGVTISFEGIRQDAATTQPPR